MSCRFLIAAMQLLQFSTSHYCRKARLVLGYKRIPYTTQNLTPGLHALKLKPLTGLTTVPVLLPEDNPASAIADSTRILHFLETYSPQPSLSDVDPTIDRQIWMLEDWFDESIGTATRFVYYDYRAKDGKQIDSSLSSQLVIQIVRRQYDISPAKVSLAADRLTHAIALLEPYWKFGKFWVGDRFTAADLTAAALLSPLALIPNYRESYPWLFDRICEIHALCNEPNPPGLEA